MRTACSNKMMACTLACIRFTCQELDSSTAFCSMASSGMTQGSLAACSAAAVRTSRVGRLHAYHDLLVSLVLETEPQKHSFHCTEDEGISTHG